MILNTASKVVRFRLGGAITTNEVDWNASYADHLATARTFTPGHSGGTSSGASDVTAVAAPASGQRHVKSLYWQNRDTANVTIIVEIYDGSNARRWYMAVLEPDWTLEWEAGGSWKVYDANGRQKIETTPGTGGGGGIAVAAGGATASSGTVVFSNSNGISFGLVGSVMTASHNGITSQSNQQMALYMGGNTTQGSSGTQDATSMGFSGAGLASVGFSNGSIIISATAPAQSNQTLGLYALGSTTQSSSGTADARSLSFYGAGIVSVGVTGGSVLISATGGGGGITPALSGSNGSFSFSTATFGNLNGISFYTSNGSMVASHNALTSQSNQAASGSNGSFTFQTLSFGNSNGFSFYTTNSSIVGSYTVPTQTVQPVALSGSNGSFSYSTATFGNLNGISFYTSNGSMVASHNALTSQSNQALSGSNGSFTFQTATFGNLNGLSFYTSNGSMVGSYTVPTQTNQTLGLYAVSNTTGAGSSTTLDARTISFAGAGVASVGFSAGSIIISVPAGGGGLTNINISAGTTSQNLSNLVFSNGGNVSFGLNGSTITASAPAGGAGVTLSGYDGFANNEMMAIAGGQASLWVDRLDLPCAVQFDRFGLRITHSNATGSSGSATISVWVGLSTRNASTFSSVMSTSFTTAITASGTAGSYSLFSGVRILPIPWTTTISAGNYWLGIVTRTTTGGANMTFGNMANSQVASTMAGYFGSATSATNAIRLGVGVYSVTTAGMPTAISITQIYGNSSAFLRQPAYLFMSNIF